jgi:hypothetical protein
MSLSGEGFVNGCGRSGLTGCAGEAGLLNFPVVTYRYCWSFLGAEFIFHLHMYDLNRYGLRVRAEDLRRLGKGHQLDIEAQVGFRDWIVWKTGGNDCLKKSGI